MRALLSVCHASEGWHPVRQVFVARFFSKGWMPAFAGMTMVGFVLVAAPAIAAERAEPHDSTVSVVGTAIIKLTPDQVTVPVTISTEDVGLSKAKELNDKKVKKILELAEKYGASKDDVSTTYHSVEPQMGYGNNVTVETEVFTGSVNYSINVQGIAQDKIDGLIESLQKAEIESVNFSSQQQYSQVNGSFSAKNDKADKVRDVLKQNQEKVTKIVLAAGVAKDKIGVNTTQGKGKETRSQPYKQKIEKYKAVVMLSVKLKDKDKAVEFVNASLKEGVENVGSIQFGLKDEKALQDKASLEALKDAKRKAIAIAEAMGLTLERPLNISANDGQVVPLQPYNMVGRMRAENGYAMDGAVPMLAMKSEQSVSEPGALPTGLIEVHANVSATFLLKQK